MKEITECGIVINKYDWGESDRTLIIFTPTNGKLSFYIKGLRKSKKRGIIEILTKVKVKFYILQEKYKLVDIEILDDYECVKLDYDKLNLSLYILSILNAFIMENEQYNKIYDITLKSLDYLKKEKTIKNCYILVVYFLYFVIKYEGVAIHFNSGEYFSFSESKFTNIKTEKIKDRFKVYENQKYIINKLIKNNVKDIIKSDLGEKDIISTIYLLERYLNYHFDTKLNFKNYIIGG